ncbi:ABC transporter permease [Wenjunlia tyrosinilytica]|uniref:ABC transporter permease n=1 Tax=Wenjunlia tyrosinilytica TaxID=1544741 RepID=A0A917ZUA1_9ACTN|nr:ABC transporter permease [Wenjunlia tyrosinilytica]GGO92057.1 ABC transporter permease [Wenjunlia tyrosinilytica]
MTVQTATSPAPGRRSAQPEPPPGRGRLLRTGLRHVRSWPLPFTVAAAFLALTTVAALLAPLIAPQDPQAIDLNASSAPPDGVHLLGTDQSGRDLLSRVLFGARTSLVAPLALLLCAAVIGVALGTLAAWRGGWTDALVSRVTDVMFAFPGLLFVVLIIAVFGDGLTTAVVALALAYSPVIAKYTRSIALSERAKPYIDAYRVQGVSGFSICVRHLLPNLAAALLGYLVLMFGEVLMGMTTLSYLGFGAQPPSSEWGLMVKEGQAAIVQGALWPALVPGTAIALTVVAFNIVGVRVSDRLGARER